MPLAVFPTNAASPSVVVGGAGAGPFKKETPGAFTGYSNLQKRQIDDLYAQLNGVCGVFSDKHKNLYDDLNGDGTTANIGICGRLVSVEDDRYKYWSGNEGTDGSLAYLKKIIRDGDCGSFTAFDNWKKQTFENEFQVAYNSAITGTTGRIVALENLVAANATSGSEGLCGSIDDLHAMTLGLSGKLNERIDGNCGSIHGLCGWVNSFTQRYDADIGDEGICGYITNLYDMTVGLSGKINERIDGLCGTLHGLCGWVKSMQDNISTIADDYIHNKIADYTYDKIKDDLTMDGITGSTLALALAERMAAVYQRDLDEAQWNAIRAVLPEAKEYTDAELADLHVAVGGEILGAKSQLEGRILAMEEYIRTMLTTYQISTDGSSLYAYTGKTQDVAIPNEIEVAEGVTADNTANQVFWAASRYALGANDWNLVLQFSDYGYNNLYNKVRVEVPAFTGVCGAVAAYNIEFDKQDISRGTSHFHHVTLANCQGVSGANATYMIENDLVVKYLALDGSVVHEIVLSKAAFEALTNNTTVYPLAITSGATGSTASHIGFIFTNSGASSETVKVYSNRLGLVSIADVTAAAGATASINVLGTNLEAGDVLYLVALNGAQKSGYYRMPALPSFSYSGPAILTKDALVTSIFPTKTVAPTSWSISPALPAGLTHDPVTGVFSGTPTALLDETIYTITGSNISGSSTATLSIRVNAASYSYEIKSVTKVNNKWTLTYDITSVVPNAKFFSTTFAYPIGTPEATIGTGKIEDLALEEYLAEGGQVYVAVTKEGTRLSKAKRVDDPNINGLNQPE